MKKLREEWAPIKGYEGYYEVSTYGRVKNIKVSTIFAERVRILKPSEDRGSVQVMLTKPIKKLHLVHRLVAEAFHPNPQNKSEVNHIDANRQNNYFLNLEWASPKENCKHRNYMQLDMTQKMTKTVDVLGEIRVFESKTAAAEYHGVSQSNLTKYMKAKKKCHGILFSYIEVEHSISRDVMGRFIKECKRANPQCTPATMYTALQLVKMG